MRWPQTLGSQLSWRPALLIAMWWLGHLPRKGKRLQASDLTEGVTRVTGSLPVLCSGALYEGSRPFSGGTMGRLSLGSLAGTWPGSLSLCPCPSPRWSWLAWKKSSASASPPSPAL